MKKLYSNLLLLVLLLPLWVAAQAPAITRVNPTNWWVGMKEPKLQLLVYGPNAGTLTYTITYPGVKLGKATAERPAPLLS